VLKLTVAEEDLSFLGDETHRCWCLIIQLYHQLLCLCIRYPNDELFLLGFFYEGECKNEKGKSSLTLRDEAIEGKGWIGMEEREK